MTIPAIYSKTFINKLSPVNDEQKKLMDIMEKMFPAELARQTINAYCNANPSDDVRFGANWNVYPDRYKIWEELDKELDIKMADSKWCLSIIGTVGNGKTTLACALVNSYQTYLQKKYRNIDVIYETFHSLLRDYKSKFDADYFHRICNCDFLIIDELTFNSRYSEFNEEVLGDILVNRHLANKKTIIIGNLTLEQFKSMFESQPHVLSRLRQGYFFQMVGEDLRPQYGR